MNKEKLKKAPHVISGVMIVLHSLERFEAGHRAFILFLCAGLVFLTIAIFHKPITRKFPLADATFYGIESLLSFIVAYEYWSVGKVGLPIPYVIAGLFQIFAIYKFVTKAKRKGILYPFHDHN